MSLLQKLSSYTPIHVHTTLSNDTYFDSTVNFEDYIPKIKEYGINSISFTEHGNVLQWIKKKQVSDDNGVKYIHGCEFYMSFDLNKRERQNYHILLYSKNLQGVKELNKLSSKSFEGVNEKWYPGIQYYYRPRISFEQLKSTSDNIIVSTACLASPLWRRKGTEEADSYIKWLAENKHRCFLEVQPHTMSEDQKEYNKYVLELSNKFNIPIIAGTDTHVLNKEDNRLRDVLQRGKKATGEDGESEFSLHLRTLDEIIGEFKEQGVLDDNQIYEAISNTNILSNMCENWKLDYTHKYPRISKNPEEELWNRLLAGIEKKKINEYEPKKRKQYLDAIKFEYDTYVKLGNCDYFVLLDDMIKFCKANNIATSPRGSCNGSQTLWCLGITDIDPIKYGTLFFRFMNPNRVSLADVDIDMAGSLRPLVKDYLYNKKGLQCSAIVTYTRMALRASCRLVAKGLGYDIETENMVTKDIEEISIENEDETITIETTFHNEDKWRKKYPEWIELAYKAVGIITETSTHACGFVTYDGNINEDIGIFRTKNSKWVISQNDMKAIDSVNFVKMDLLSVDNIQIVSDTEKSTGIILHNDELDLEDDDVWSEMLKSGLGIFQFEKSGWFSLKKALENYDNFKKNNKNVTRYFIMLALNGVIRPSCASFREQFLQGIPNDNGHEAINLFFANMNNYCIFQEQIMLFLEKFCHYSGSESDTVRRGISKKGGTDKFVPMIHDSFMKNFMTEYNASEKESENAIAKFIEIIKNASRYGFSINHSTPYTLLGYKNAYYRNKYPLEYLTSQLNVNDGKFEKTQNIISFIKEFTDIKIESIKFRKSTSKYNFNKEDNAIYKGMKSIKDIGTKTGDELYKLKNYNFDTFTDLLVAIKPPVHNRGLELKLATLQKFGKINVNQGQLEILIRLDFFSEFGKSKKLVNILNMYSVWSSKSVAKLDNLPFSEEILERNSEKKTENQFSGVDYISVIRECEGLIKNEDFSICEKIKTQIDHLGYINLVDPNEDVMKVVVTNLDTKYSPKFNAYCIKKGTTGQVKVRKKALWNAKDEDSFKTKPFKNGDILFIHKFSKEPARKNVNGEWVDTGEFDYWAVKYEILERS